MVDETDLIPLCNDERTCLCYNEKLEYYWVYAPTVGRDFPAARTPEGAWKNWYTILASMANDEKLKNIFLSAAESIKEPIPMDMIQEIKRQKETT